MAELIIQEKEKSKKIALVENDRLVEYYEEDETIKRK